MSVKKNFGSIDLQRCRFSSRLSHYTPTISKIFSFQRGPHRVYLNRVRSNSHQLLKITRHLLEESRSHVQNEETSKFCKFFFGSHLLSPKLKPKNYPWKLIFSTPRSYFITITNKNQRPKNPSKNKKNCWDNWSPKFCRRAHFTTPKSEYQTFLNFSVKIRIFLKILNLNFFLIFNFFLVIIKNIDCANIHGCARRWTYTLVQTSKDLI